MTTKTQAETFVAAQYRANGAIADLAAANAALAELDPVDTDEDNVTARRFPDGSIVYQIVDGAGAGELLTQRHLDESKAEAAYQASLEG